MDDAGLSGNPLTTLCELTEGIENAWENASYCRESCVDIIARSSFSLGRISPLASCRDVTYGSDVGVFRGCYGGKYQTNIRRYLEQSDGQVVTAGGPCRCQPLQIEKVLG